MSRTDATLTLELCTVHGFNKAVWLKRSLTINKLCINRYLNAVTTVYAHCTTADAGHDGLGLSDSMSEQLIKSVPSEGNIGSGNRTFSQV